MELVADVGEVGLDSLTDGPLKEIPVLGSVLKLCKAGVQVRDLIFLSKLTRFLRRVREGERSAVQAFARTVASDTDLKNRVGTNILIAIERLDDIEKPELLARAFLLLADDRITYEKFTEFALAIDRCLIADLEHLENSSRRIEFSSSVGTRLSSCGLVEVESVPTVRADDEHGNRYRTTVLGRELVELVLDR
jgi:hypothetical protein